MFNNNNINGNNSQNIWDQMALFNQLKLCNILYSSNNLGIYKLRATMAAISNEKRDNSLVFLNVTLRSW